MQTLDGPDSILYVALVFLLILSAFFSASETSLSSVNKLRLRRRAEHDKRAGTALGLTEDYDKSLFSILIGNNIVNIAISSIATVLATTLLGPKGAVLATVVVTVAVLVFGEILPKTYASDNSEQVAVRVARPLQAVITILTPLTALFSALKRLLYKLLPRPKQGPSVTEEELLYMIDHIEAEGVLEEQESDLVQSALQFDEIAVQEILTPRVNIVALDVESTAEQVKDVVVEEGYARIPVYEGSIDNVVGILYSREFLNAYVSGKNTDLRAMLGAPLFVHKRMRLSQLLSLLKARKTNIAVVTDDYGGTMGIVTMEDVLEELVGDIYDEDDEIPVGLVRIDDNTVEVEGDYELDDLFETLDITGEETESDYTTVNGWALHKFGYIPEAKESIEADGFALTILEMDGNRIRRLRVTMLPEETGTA